MIPYTPAGNFPVTVSLADTTDVVMGGVNGTANVATKELADRTQYLFNARGRIGNIVEIDNAGSQTIALVAGYIYNSAVRVTLSLALNTQITLPDLSGTALPDGAVIHINVHSAFPDKCVRLTTAFIFQSIRDGRNEYLYLYLYGGDGVSLVVNDGQWEVLHLTSNQYRVGEQVVNYRHMQGTLIKLGQLVNRADYPRLWEFLSAPGTQATLLSDAQWQSSGKTLFSTGNGTTTFRVPFEQFSATGMWPQIIF